MAREWRLMVMESSDAADLAAVPAAIAEGRIASRYAMAAKAPPETVIVQHVGRRGLLVGAEVSVDTEEAGKRDIDVAVMPRSGRGAMRPVDTISLKELMSGSEQECVAVERDDDDLAALLYTSGTTGEPKGVMLTHGNFMAECEIATGVLQCDETDRFVSLVPFFHVFGLADGAVVPFHNGCCTILVPQYSPRTFVEVIERGQPTVILAIPTQYSHLVMASRRRPVQVQRPLKYCISGASALPAAVIEEFRSRFGAPIVEGYGMTETTAAATLNPADAVKVGSIGPPGPGVEMKVVDEQGHELGPGEQGELLVRGGNVCKGYYNRPDETAEAFDAHGFLRTGDVGYRDEDGYYYITDRKKDIIIKGGYNISPHEIEEVLIRHPKVSEAAVIGHIGAQGRETIRAYCVLGEGETATQSEILDFCRRNLASYKAPDSVEFVESLPRGLTGKLLRRELRESLDSRSEQKGMEQ